MRSVVMKPRAITAKLIGKPARGSTKIDPGGNGGGGGGSTARNRPNSGKGYRGLPIFITYGDMQRFGKLLDRPFFGYDSAKPSPAGTNRARTNWITPEGVRQYKATYSSAARGSWPNNAGFIANIQAVVPQKSKPGPALFDEINAGTWDATLSKFADDVVDGGFTDLWISCFHEYPGDWYPYKLKDVGAARFKSGWERCYDKIKSRIIQRGANPNILKICLTGFHKGSGVTRETVAAAMPSKGYVDAVGYDVYPPAGTGNRYPDAAAQIAQYELQTGPTYLVTLYEQVADDYGIDLHVGEWGSVRQHPTDTKYDGWWDPVVWNELWCRRFIEKRYAFVTNFNGDWGKAQGNYGDGCSIISDQPNLAVWPIIRRYWGANPEYLPT
jgi:hypothetical protein